MNATKLLLLVLASIISNKQSACVHLRHAHSHTHSLFASLYVHASLALLSRSLALSRALSLALSRSPLPLSVRPTGLHALAHAPSTGTLTLTLYVPACTCMPLDVGVRSLAAFYFILLKNKYADSSYFAACTLQKTKKYFLLSEARAPVHIHQISTGGSRGGDTAVQ